MEGEVDRGCSTVTNRSLTVCTNHRSFASWCVTPRRFFRTCGVGTAMSGRRKFFARSQHHLAHRTPTGSNVPVQTRALFMIYDKLTRDECVQPPYPPRFFRSANYVAISAIWFSLSLSSKSYTPMIRPLFHIPRIYRGFSTHANSSSPIPATLHLKTGQSFAGRSFGAPRSIYGETVFSTSITSCNEFYLIQKEIIF